MLFRLSVGLVSALLLLPSVLAAPAHTPRAFSVTLNGQVARPWPDKTLTIAYENESDKFLLDDIVQSAMKLWSETGIKLVTKVGYTDTEKVLRTTANSNGAMVTTVGYRPGQTMTMTFDPKPATKKGNGDSVVGMAHELGHALGLFHEHQRSDAYTTYLNFNCENLADYDDKKKNNDMNELCTSYFSAAGATFSAAEFITYPDAGFDQSGPFDMDSLMRYGAKYGGKPQNAILGRKVVLSRRDGQKLEDPVKPSTGDIARLRALYP